MELGELRSVANKRLKVFGLDKSDIDYTIQFWAFFFVSAAIFSGLDEGVFHLHIGQYIFLSAMLGIFPMAFVVKALKKGKEKGHLEYLSYSLLNLKEGRKNKKIFIYNLKRSGFLYKTLFYVTKKK